MIFIDGIERQADVPQNFRQLVVEVMGDEAGQSTHHFEFLLFAELVFQPRLSPRLLRGHMLIHCRFHTREGRQGLAGLAVSMRLNRKGLKLLA